MTDPVSSELEARAREPLRWRRALAGALVVHVGAGLALVLGGSQRPRALSLPSVQVRIAPGLPVLAAPPAAAQPARSQAPAAAPRAAAAPPPPPARKAVAIDKAPAPSRATPQPAPPQPSPESGPAVAAAGDSTAAPGTAGAGRGGSGGVALGSGNGTEESFPFAYYLNRVLGTIESNWFKPPVPPGTRCRVRCRIDRSGRVVDAGIEEPSGVPAFDRAALRAVYASAPFPPLPLGFSGASLTLHLEFGP